MLILMLIYMFKFMFILYLFSLILNNRSDILITMKEIILTI
jgi:hypothetical protein